MTTLTVIDVASGDPIDRVTLDGDELEYDTGVARDMFESLEAVGLTPAQAFDARTGWSNGYIRTSLPIEPGGKLPAIPGLREMIEGVTAGGAFAARAAVASALLAVTDLRE